MYDPTSREFDFHSPTDSSIKWWPGCVRAELLPVATFSRPLTALRWAAHPRVDSGLGKSATHCILMARLFLHGKDYGPHPFIIQLRSLETHHPLPGVELGDIGPKVPLRPVQPFCLARLTNGFVQTMVPH